MATNTRKTSNVINEIEAIDDRIDLLETTTLSRHTAGELKTDYESNNDTNAFTDAEQTKLGGIEALAQVNPTNTEIKTSYEANDNTNVFTDEEKSKLAGIASGAQANQGDYFIKVQYENNANTNAFTDDEKSKLGAIEPDSTADMTPAEIKSAYESNDNTNAFSDALEAKLNGIETGATADQSAAEIKSLYESNGNTNAFLDTDRVKLDNIEAGATGDMTGSEIRAALESQPNTEIFSYDEKNKLSLIESEADRTDTTNVVASLTAGTNITISPSGIISAIIPTPTSTPSDDTDTSSGGTGTSSGVTFLPGSNIIFDTDGDETTINAVYNQTFYSVGDGGLTENNFTTSLKSKLEGIATGAQVNPTAAEILTSVKTVDGVNSGLDADLLDGQHGNYYLDYNNAVNKPAVGDGGFTERNFTATLKTKLDNINAVWVKTAYENNINRNGFTDAEKAKLAGLPSTALVDLESDTSPRLSANLDGGNRNIANVQTMGINGSMYVGHTVNCETVDADGNITAGNNVTVNGIMTASSMSVAGNGLVSGTLWNSGGLTLNSNAALTLESGSTASLQDATFAGAITANSTSTFAGNMRVNAEVKTDKLHVLTKALFEDLDEGFRVVGDATHPPLVQLSDSRANAAAIGTIGINPTYGNGRRFEIKCPNHDDNGQNRWLEHSETGETYFFSRDVVAGKIGSIQEFMWGYFHSDVYSSLASGADQGFSITASGKIHCGINEDFGHFWVYNGASSTAKLHRFMYFPSSTNSGTSGEAGSITVSAGQTQYLTSSDRRVKTEVNPNPDCLEAINRLKARQYKLKGAEEAHIGLYAQEVLEVPEFAPAVNDDGEYLSMDYSKLVGALVGAVNQLTEQNKSLETRIAALEAAS